MLITMRAFPINKTYEYKGVLKKICKTHILWKPLVGVIKRRGTLELVTKDPTYLKEEAVLRLTPYGLSVLNSSLTTEYVEPFFGQVFGQRQEEQVNPYVVYCVMYAFFLSGELKNYVRLIKEASSLPEQKEDLINTITNFLFDFGEDRSTLILSQV